MTTIALGVVITLILIGTMSDRGPRVGLVLAGLGVALGAGILYLRAQRDRQG